MRELTETTVSADVLRAVDRYFTQDATIVHPMLNSPQSSGRDGVKAAYKMLKGERGSGRRLRPGTRQGELTVLDGIGSPHLQQQDHLPCRRL